MSKSKFPQNRLNTTQLALSWMLFHPQTSSYLLSQLSVTHLGVALLFLFFISIFVFVQPRYYFSEEGDEVEERMNMMVEEV